MDSRLDPLARAWQKSAATAPLATASVILSAVVVAIAVVTVVVLGR